MRERISWQKVIMTTIGAQILSFVIFLMVEVLWADLIKDYLGSLYVEDIYIIPFFILLIGIFISLSISIAIYMIFIKDSRSLVIILCIVSVMLTGLALVFISFVTVEYLYSDIFAEFTALEKVSLMPQYVTFFSIYILESPVLLWDITSLIFGFFMLILIKSFVYEERKTKKIKPLLERII